MKKKYRCFLASAFCLAMTVCLSPPHIAKAAEHLEMSSKIPAEVQTKIEERFDADGLRNVYKTLFQSGLKKQNAKVVSEKEAADVPVALTRLKNEKVAYSVNGKPFYPMAIETGWWDTRVDNNGGINKPNPGTVGNEFKKITDDEWNSYFADMANMGFNTVELMTYWQDWQPTANGPYDFTFLDKVTNLAAKHGLKTQFVLFLHTHTDNIPRCMDNFWGYHLDEIKDSKNQKYALTMQWGLDKNNEKLTSAEDIRGARDKRPYEGGANGIENFLEYWHPTVFQKLTNALTALGEHFKNSSNIIGYQIGNEEGFNFYVDNGNDKNPYYLQLKKYWKADNPNLSENDFRAALIQNLWTCFNNSLHKGDAYKPTTTNTQSGAMEKYAWTKNQYTNDGTTLDFYKSVDMVGSMFYGDASSIYPHLDKVYAGADGQGYSKGFPILFPTEISGTMNGVATQISAQTIARGGQGLGFYCFGELYNNFEEKLFSSPKPQKDTMINLLKTFKFVQPYIWSGIPVKKGNQHNVYMEINSINDKKGRPTLTVMDTNDNRTMGVLYFPGYSNGGGSDVNVTVNLTAKKPGIYKVGIHKTNSTVEIQSVTVNKANESVPVIFSSSANMATYLTVEPVDSPVKKATLSGIEIIKRPNQKEYSVGGKFNSEGMQVIAKYDDGSRKIVDNDLLKVDLNTDTVGEKNAVVSYTENNKTFTADLKVNVKIPKYESNLLPYNGYDNALDLWFDGKIKDPALSGPMVADNPMLEKMKNQQVYVQYNFGKMVKINGVNLWTNYGNDQGIKSFKIAIPDGKGNWKFIDENKDNAFNLDWNTHHNPVEKLNVSFKPVFADSIRLYITNVGHSWDENGGGVKKFTMREIEFQTKDIPVTNLKIQTLPQKQDYFVGEKLDTKGMKVIAVYDGGYEKDVTSLVTIGDYNFSSKGEKNITVSYKGQSTSFTVKVNEKEKAIEKPTEKATEKASEKATEKPKDEKIVLPVETKSNHTNKDKVNVSNKESAKQTPNTMNNVSKNNISKIKTGDDRSIRIFVGLAVMAFSILVFLNVYRKKIYDK